MVVKPEIRRYLRLGAAGALSIASASALACDAAEKIAGVAPVASVSVAIASPSLTVGAKTQATATLRDNDGSVVTGRAITWSSSDETVASVSATGEVTALKAGTAEIRATSEGKDGSATLSVTSPPVASVTVSLASPTLSVGATTTATAQAKDAAGNLLTGPAIVWSTDNPQVAIVDEQGVVTASRIGNATITATSEGKTGSAAIVVAGVVYAVYILRGSLYMGVGSSLQNTATLYDADENFWTGPVVWTSANPEIATVSQQGLITAVGVGDTRIFATSEGKTGEAALRVGLAGPVARIRVTFANYNNVLVPGETVQALPDVEDQNGYQVNAPVTWTSSNQAVATVDQTGMVRALSHGTVTITATSQGVMSTALQELHVIVVRAQSLSAGHSHTCAISTDGVAYCWGSNTNGELGDGTATSRSTPVRVGGGLKFTSIAAGWHVTHAIAADGSFFCWGGAPCARPWQTPGILTPIRMNNGVIPIYYLSAGTGSFDAPNCGIAIEDNAYCWGNRNESGQQGTGDPNNRLVPSTPVRHFVTRDVHRMKELSAGNLHACGLRQDGSAECWGADAAGQLGRNGNGTIGWAPERVAGGQTFTRITAGDEFSCALDTGGAAYCWGDNTHGQLGAVTAPCLGRSTPCSTTPVAVTGGHTFASIDAGGRDVCAVKSSGDVYCWGEQFGAAPVPFGAGVSYRIVSVGSGHACATTTGGDIYCRNKNDAAQLGNGTTADTSVPTRVVGGVRFTTP